MKVKKKKSKNSFLVAKFCGIFERRVSNTIVIVETDECFKSCYGFFVNLGYRPFGFCNFLTHFFVAEKSFSLKTTFFVGLVVLKYNN